MFARSALALVALTSLGLVLSAASAAEAKAKNPYRRIKKGVGNCIFSTSPLPYEKEKSFQNVGTRFGSGDHLHARCYWEKPFEAYKAIGKSTNELRDAPARYRVEFSVYPEGESPAFAKGKKGKRKKKKTKTKKKKVADADSGEVDPNKKRTLQKVTVRVPLPGSETWDQRDFDFDENAKRCLFPAEFGMKKCLDLNAAVIEQASVVNKTIPYTADVCLSVLIAYEDIIGGPKEKVLSTGCFQYAATSLGLPPAP